MCLFIGLSQGSHFPVFAHFQMASRNCIKAGRMRPPAKQAVPAIPLKSPCRPKLPEFGGVGICSQAPILHALTLLAGMSQIETLSGSQGEFCATANQHSQTSHVFTDNPSRSTVCAFWNKRLLAEPTREDALVVACTWRIACPQAERARGKPWRYSAIAQRVASDAL